MRINISLPNEIVRQLQITTPQGQRSRFIAEALSEKLKKKANLEKEFARSLKINHKFYKNEAKAWKVLETETWPE